MKDEYEQVLGLHPCSRGFGWIFFETPGAPFDWGTADIRGGDNARALAQITSILTKYQPGVLALEEFDGKVSRRRPRIRALYRQIARDAEQRGTTIRIYSREDIRQVFPGASTRQEIADRIAKKIVPLRPRLPKPRKIWDSERSNMALFSAAACALTYFAERDPPM
ncbi:MAG: hypothetical protein JOY77_07305 [Alphaproteobacteria bacterium]|nr:hypothetical protein [Alphaproteobacteria bacterium]